MKQMKMMGHKATKLGLALAVCAALLVFTLALLLPSTVSRGQEPQLPPEKVQLLSGGPMLIAAEELGISVIAGKDVSLGGSPPGNANAKKPLDVGIGIHPTQSCPI